MHDYTERFKLVMGPLTYSDIYETTKDQRINTYLISILCSIINSPLYFVLISTEDDSRTVETCLLK